MTFTHGSRWFQKTILSLLGLASVTLPGRAFQIAAELPSAATAGTTSYGVLHGVTKGPNGLTVFGVQVTVQNVDEKIRRTVLSGSDGNFLIADLKPGQYNLTARAEGIGASSPATVQISQNQVTYTSIQLAAAEAPAQPADSSVPDSRLKTRAAEPPLSESAVVAELAAMKARIEFLEAELLRQRSRDRAPGDAVVSPGEAPRQPLVASAA